MHTYTFSKRQIDQVSSALRILIKGNLLDEDEKKVADRLIWKFKAAKVGKEKLPSGEPYAQVYTTEEESKLLEHVEESLWRG